MRPTFVLMLISGCSLAGGCAMNYGVMKVGPDTYQVSAVAAPARGGIIGAHEKTNDSTVHEPASDRAVVTFTCS